MSGARSFDSFGTARGSVGRTLRAAGERDRRGRDKDRRPASPARDPLLDLDEVALDDG